MTTNLQLQRPALHLLFIVLGFFLILSNGQNTCTPSSANDKIFVGSSTLSSGMLKPGINTFSIATGIIESLVPSTSVYNQSKLQIAHSFRNFASSVQNNVYEMNDFSFHSVLVNNTQIKFLFLWNQLSSISVTISMSIQFLLTYDREEFLMGSFVIDSVQFLLKDLNQNEVNYSRSLKFKDYNALTTLPSQSSSVSVNLFIVGLRYLGSGINIQLKNESYSLNSTELTFTIQRNSTTAIGLYLLHISYVLFDKTFLSTQFKMFFSWIQLANQSKIDYWMKGMKQIDFNQFQSGNVDMSEIYFYKINRLRCSQGCAGCVSVSYCQNIQGVTVNDTQCVICASGSSFNYQTLKCEQQTGCGTNQIWNGTQCICRSGFVVINSQCIQCPQNTVYNSITQTCDIKCDQNSTLTTNSQCICKQGFNIIDGKCSKCPTNTSYDSVSKKCLLICSVVEIYNSTSQKCECISGLYRISGMCGKCSSGFVYDNVTQSCLYKCATNQVFTNGTCQCLSGFVIISGSCSKCPTGTIYNSLLKICTPTCTGNRKILNGKCVCNDGTYEIGTQCSICPQGSTYNNVSKNCSTTTNCKPNEVLVNNTCTCNGPYTNGVCQPCSSNLIWNNTSQQCILKCPANSLYNSTYKACVCSDGFYVIGQTCDVCTNGTVYDFSTRSCQNGQTCSGANEVYYMGLCICNVGFFRIKSNCSTCPSGSVYNETIFDCQAVCNQNQIYNSTSLKCECNSTAGYYRFNSICQLCPSGTNYNTTSFKCENICPSGQILTNNRCTCPTGFYLIGTTCGICDIGTVYNESILKCDKACPDPNGYYQNGRCYCYPPYVVVNQTSCQQCPANSTYDLSSLSCKSSTPSNNTNLTCNSTTQIKTLNTTSGQYYCACDLSQKYYFVYDRCATCQIFTKYNPDTKSCELDTSLLTSNSVYYFEGGSPITVGSNVSSGSSTCLAKDNKVLVNGSCKCITTAIKFGNLCIVCPTNSAPNSNQTACQCKTGYKLSLVDYTCKLIVAVQQGEVQCPTNQIWNQIQCVCVEQYYRINGTCMKCPSLSAYNGTTCVCQNGYYAHSLTSLKIPTNCLNCHSSCSSCTGPSALQCITCSNISSILTNGQCIQQNCSIGYYYLVYSSTGAKCQKCSAYCKSCTSALQCKQCVDGFSIYNHTLTPSLSVKVCSETCGDGKRFQRNCDDGNTVSGDGCSKDCQVQTGWACVGGTTTSKDICSSTTPAPKAIITVMNATIQRSTITQNIRLSYIPEFFLKTECSLCSNLFKLTVTQAKILPDSMKVTYIQKSKYQFSIEFKFSDILAIPIFKFGVQLNPEYKQYFTEWDMAQWYDVQVNSALLSKKSTDTYLRADDTI